MSQTRGLKKGHVIFAILAAVLEGVMASIPTNPCEQSTPCVCKNTLVVRESMEVDCQGRKLNGIPTFEGIGVAKEVILTYNDIPKIEADAFKGISPREIDFSHNDISDIDKDAFSHLDSTLKILSLKSNKLRSVPTSGLSRLGSLLVLNLDNNPGLKTLKSGAFRGLESLEKLTLSRCSLADIEENAFEGMKKLQELILYENNLRAISSSIFPALSSLEQLDLGHNGIQAIPPHAFRNIKRLSLNMNNFSSNASFDPEAFAGIYASLEYLNLAHCRMKNIPTQALRKLRSLEKLELNHNQLSVLDQEDFQGLTSLQGLILDENNIKFSGHALLEVSKTLRFLSVRKVNMKSIPLSVLQDLVALQKIDISENELEVLGDNFFNGVCAKQYEIENASIHSVSKTAFNNTVDGIHVVLKRNTIRNLEFLDIPCKFAVVNAEQNLVNCDCAFLELLDRHNFTMDGVCHRPRDLTEVTIGNPALKQYREQNCPKSTTNKTWSCSRDKVSEVIVGELSPSRCYSNKPRENRKDDATHANAHASRLDILGMFLFCSVFHLSF